MATKRRRRRQTKTSGPDVLAQHAVMFLAQLLTNGFMVWLGAQFLGGELPILGFIAWGWVGIVTILIMGDSIFKILTAIGALTNSVRASN